MWKFISDSKSRDFFRYWFAQLVSQFGDRIYQMALVGMMTALHPGSVMAMSKVIGCAMIPTFLLGPIAGVYIDRWDRRTVLFITYFIQALLVWFGAFYLVRLPFIWPMYLVVFLIACLSRFYIPAKMAFLPEIVHHDDLHIANSLSNITGMIAGGLGVLLGSLIVDKMGFFAGLYGDAGCYLTAAAMVFTITALRYRVDKKGIIAGAKEVIRLEKSVWHEILEGIRYILSHKELRFIFWTMFILLAAVGAVYVVIIIFIQQAFHSVTRDLGFLAVSTTAGLFLGSLAYGKWGKNIAAYSIIFWSLILGGGMLMIFAGVVNVTHSRLWAVILSFVFGFISGPVMIAPYTEINRRCATEMSGKVFAALEFVVYLAFLLAMMASSFLSQYIERLWILVGVSGIFMVVGLIGLIKGDVE